MEGGYQLDDYIGLCGVVCGLVVVVSFQGKFVELGLAAHRSVMNFLQSILLINGDNFRAIANDSDILYSSSPGRRDSQFRMHCTVIVAASSVNESSS